VKRDRESLPLTEVIEELRGGARLEDGFRLLFDRFYGPLFRFFAGRGFTADECQDLIQETFLRVHRGIAGFRGAARWEHWVFRIAANTAVKALRRAAAAKRAGRTVPLEELDDAEGALGAAAQADAPLRRLLDQERTQRLGESLAGLPARMLRCVRLRVFQDLDVEEIAEVLQISPSTVKVQLFKARKRLKTVLADSLADFDL